VFGRSKKLKVGDKIILRKSNRGLNQWNGDMLEIVAVHDHYYTCKNVKRQVSGTGTVYCDSSSGQRDDFIPVDRKARIECLVEELDAKQRECVEMAKELKDLRRFKTEEDAVAFKISEIIKTKGNAAAIAEVLRELKKTDYL